MSWRVGTVTKRCCTMACPAPPKKSPWLVLSIGSLRRGRSSMLSLIVAQIALSEAGSPEGDPIHGLVRSSPNPVPSTPLLHRPANARNFCSIVRSSAGSSPRSRLANAAVSGQSSHTQCPRCHLRPSLVRFRTRADLPAAAYGEKVPKCIDAGHPFSVTVQRF
jgi:hypothetical protein